MGGKEIQKEEDRSMQEVSEEHAKPSQKDSSATDSDIDDALRASTLSKQHKKVIHRSVKRWDNQIANELAKESNEVQNFMNDPKNKRK